MKIAFITNDGITISRHFGRATHYLVCEVQDGKVIKQELREKLGHNQFFNEEKHGEHPQAHGVDAASQRKHGRMVDAINDCEVIVSGGMGMGAYQSIQALHIKPIVTDLTDIQEALSAYLSGNLSDQTDMLH